MGKKCNELCGSCSHIREFLMVMKLTILLFFTGLISLNAATYSGAAKINPGVENPASVAGTVKSNASSDQQQKKKISGSVKDENGEPIIGATIIVSGTTLGTLTDIGGKFALEIPADSKTLSVSFVGLETQDFAIEKLTEFNLILKSTAIALSEVVVVGYGVQKKESVVGAITQVDNVSIVKSGVSTITNAIAGKLSGVLTLQQSGQPGINDAEIIIRGLSSWNGSQPLIMVDGVERDFKDLDPNEINTISVLKDASSTAVFGAKGANGVILVTTKRGITGKPDLNFSASTGIDIPTRLPKFIDSYTTMSLLNVANMNGQAFQALIPESSLAEFKNPSTRLNSIRYPNNNWIDLLTNSFAPNSQANLNITGGTRFVKYFASFGYLHQGSLFDVYHQGYDDMRFRYDRLNYRANLDFAISASTNLSFNVGGDVGIQTDFPGGFWRTLFSGSVSRYPAYYPAWVLEEVPDPDYPDATGMRYAANTGDIQGSPYIFAHSGSFDKTLESKIFSDLILQQKLDFITKGLSFKGKFSLSTYYQSTILTATLTTANGKGIPEYFLHFEDIGKAGVNPWERQSEGNEVYYQPYPLDINVGGLEGGYYTNWYYEFALNYDRKFGKHNVSALALLNMQQKNSGTGFPYYNAGVVGRATYDYSKKYLLEVNLGYTGSERFAPANRFGFFPSAAVGWVLSEEDFFKSALPWVSKFKIRYSDGLVGSDNASERWLYISDYSVSSGYIVEGSSANEAAQWEQSHKRDLGLEVSLFRNQFSFSVDLFDEFRDKMLLTPQTVTFFVGSGFKQLNLGSMKKHGFEIETEFRKTTPSKITYFIRGNFGFNENRIISKDDLPYADDYLKEAGKPLGGQLNGVNLNGTNYFTSVDELHITPSPVLLSDANVGDYQFVDYYPDGILNLQDRHPIAGSDYSPFTFSYSGGISYKGFDINLLFQGNLGKYVNYNRSFETEFLKSNYNIHESALDYWTPANPDGNHSTLNYNLQDDPKLGWAGGSSDTGGYQGMIPGRYWRNADYLRLKEVYIGYNFPGGLLKRVAGVSNILVYATGNNLLTFTSLLEGDPEVKDFILGYYPITTSIKLGIKVSF
ncbi:MAG: TonB-dependent receptor [Bacteroidia bacterium]|nr:TonB-dependent receptor [Bacteroidia bacterium]